MFVAVWVLIQVLEGVLISTARKNGMRAKRGHEKTRHHFHDAALRMPDILH